VNRITSILWLIPALPLLAAALSAVAKRRHRRFAATLAIGSMGVALGLSCLAFADALSLSGAGEAARQTFSFRWFEFGETWLKLGWVLDPLTAVMLVMVSLVGLLIFIYSAGYMAHDGGYYRFFGYFNLFIFFINNDRCFVHDFSNGIYRGTKTNSQCNSIRCSGINLNLIANSDTN